MSMSKRTPRSMRRLVNRLQHGLFGTLLTLMAGGAVGQTVSQAPLSVGNVPGNLLLVPSVEWPTLDSVANLGDYTVDRSYVGYFDAGKCYLYAYDANEANRHFYPVRTTETRTCGGTGEWSGNYLNWATTQTIDPFRKALTGGHRVRDTETETWLEKARYDGNGGNSIFPDRRIVNGNGNDQTVRNATPANWSGLTYRIWQLGTRMRFTGTGSFDPVTPPAVPVAPIVYDPAVHTTLSESNVYEVSVRVKVCDSRFVESNCKQYSTRWKPEGLIQQYSARIRYSVFGYLNDGEPQRDGGVLRARQKFVGEKKLDPVVGLIANANREWDPTTGVLVRNPDTADATATTADVGRTIEDSGVINYVNKFGGMTTRNHKTFDPVSELYYAAIRYLKRQGNVPEYSNLTGSPAEKYILADGFPVITDWDDPLQYRCQNNALLGIGDVNTWYDKNLPGNTRSNDEPAEPSLVQADDTVDVVAATAKVAELEGITISVPFNAGRESSAYIAGLAYDSHTKDIRPDLNDKQTASTYWVDVRENQILQPRTANQYWLAAKYGGFTVPENFNPYAENIPALDESLWSSGETLDTDPVNARPRNFYVASQADEMVQSLTRAFASIAETRGSSSGLAANSTRLETNTTTFQAQFYSGTWRGELSAFRVLSNGSLASTPLWRAGELLNSATWSARQIFVHNPLANTNSRHALFTWNNINATQRTALGSEGVLNYLRGDRSRERSTSPLRTRAGVLGDIVNSTPVFVGKPNERLHVGATFTGASTYPAFASAQASRTPTVYIGANDGMLHGFNASTNEETYGTESYAFVPNTVIVNGLKAYSDPAYEHRYFVDGEIAVADVYDSGWKTILVGTLGRGGSGVFALDVTNPSDVKFLWEKSGDDIPELGKNIGRPVIAQVANGDWRVLLGNGPGSSGGAAQLVMIGISSGTVNVVNTGVSGSNALTAVLARDSNGDDFSDTAYAGDLRGNLWKFSGLSGTASVTKLFEARDPSGNAQAITAAPLVGKDPATGTLWVFFGTGRYLDTADLSDKQVQTWYGIKDNGAGLGSRSDLVDRDILVEGTVAGFPVRVVEDGAVGDLVGRRGWYMDLVPPQGAAQGERMVVPNRFQGQVLIGTTRIPDATDACRPSGSGYVMAINPFTGARLDLTFFDLTRDSQFNNGDMLLVNGVLTQVSGIGFRSSPNNPLFVEDVIQVGLDDGTTDALRTQGSGVEAGRMSWRELLN